MAGLYIDTSALGRVLLGESDAPSIRKTMGGYQQLWSSRLIRVELLRLAALHGLVKGAEALLAALNMTPVASRVLDRASKIEPFTVRSLDAIHLEAAVWLHARGRISAVLTTDKQLRGGCQHHNIPLA